MLISVKFYMQPPDSGNKGTTVYLNGPGHLTKMAPITIYVLKIFFSRTAGPIALKLAV